MLQRLLWTLLLVAFQATAGATDSPAPPPDFPAVLVGDWQGGPCMGDYAFRADGTFSLKNYSPGGNSCSGKWTLHGDRFPLRLVLEGLVADCDDLLGRREFKVATLEARSFTIQSGNARLRFERQAQRRRLAAPPDFRSE